MKRVRLGSDSEPMIESSEMIMADYEESVSLGESKLNEVVQAQLKSGKLLLPPSNKGVFNKEKGK